MPTRLKVVEQRRLYDALPQARKLAVKKHCRSCQMKGEGLADIMKSIGKVLGPVAKELGPTVLKEIIVPFLKKKIVERFADNPAGSGLNPAGGTLKLAGQGKKKAKKKVKKAKK